MFDGKLPFTGFKGRTQVVRPTLGIPGLLAKHKNDLRNIQPVRLAGGDSLPDDIARLSTLRTRLLQQQKGDLFTHGISDLRLRNATIVDLQRLRFEPSAKPLVGQVGNTSEAGSYNVVVAVNGISPVSNTRFVRKDMVSVLVR